MIEEAIQTPNTKCGYVALIGRPNAGKSTLLNRILGQQVAIVTSKPQTTRNRILAVHNDGNTQFIFLDTPGLHKPTGSLGKYMNEAAGGAIEEADICVWLLDVARNNRPDHLTRDEQDIAARLQASGRPVIVLPNKVDLVKSKSTLLGLLQSIGDLNLAQDIIPISALSGDGVDVFLNALRPHLPETEWLYPADLISDQAERFFAAEIVREAVTDFTRQEIPYQSAVVVEKFVEETERCVIHATIFVERSSQKGIIIGKSGSMIKKIGERSRKAIAEFLGCAVEIQLHVTVSPGWSKDADGLKKMGYE